MISIALTACIVPRPIPRQPIQPPAQTATPIVVNIIVPPNTSASGASHTAIVATAAAPTRAPTETASLTAAATASLTITPQAAAGQDVELTPLPTGASTGLTPTDALTDTAVPTPVQPIDLPRGTVNIALLGVDQRPHMGFANTDVIVIASINPDVPAVTLLSIPRDTLVYIPGWRSNKVNTAFAHGGSDLFKQTIKYNFGINVDYYAMVNFTAVITAVDTLGGVSVVATCPLYQVFPKDPYYMGSDATPMTVTQLYTDTFTGEVWQPGTAVPTQTIDIKSPGVYSLDGMQALAYVRARYGVPGGDIDRGRREQRLIRALLVKARQIDMLPRVPQLYQRFTEDVRTDLNLENILYFAGLAGRINDAIIRSKYIDPAGLKSATFPEIGSVLIPNRQELRDYIEQSLTVALNQRPNDGIPIEVWNGTGDTDSGIVAADRLSELGFLIADVKPADHIYARTTIVDFTTTRKGSALPLLQRTFNIRNDQIIAQPNKDGPRYRIIVGSDFNPCYYQNGDLVPVQQ
ncbi:MAG: LCP family protein [Chloroflexi bacterium]|nr:LCP family protein [Chloroflexota bacterium]